MRARDIMSRDIVTVSPGTYILEAIDILIDKDISGAPVLEDNGRLIGIISEKDLMVSLDFLGSSSADTVTVGEIMTKDVVTFSEDTPIKDVIQLMVRNDVKRVPIVKDNGVVGIISRRDILEGMRKKKDIK